MHHDHIRVIRSIGGCTGASSGLLSFRRDKTREDQNTNGWLETLIDPRLADLAKFSICAASLLPSSVSVSPSSVLQ